MDEILHFLETKDIEGLKNHIAQMGFQPWEDLGLRQGDGVLVKLFSALQNRDPHKTDYHRGHPTLVKEIFKLANGEVPSPHPVIKQMGESAVDSTLKSQGFEYSMQIEEDIEEKLFDWLDENLVEYQFAGNGRFYLKCSRAEAADVGTLVNGLRRKKDFLWEEPRITLPLKGSKKTATKPDDDDKEPKQKPVAPKMSKADADASEKERLAKQMADKGDGVHKVKAEPKPERSATSSSSRAGGENIKSPRDILPSKIADPTKPSNTDDARSAMKARTDPSKLDPNISGRNVPAVPKQSRKEQEISSTEQEILKLEQLVSGSKETEIEEKIERLHNRAEMLSKKLKASQEAGKDVVVIPYKEAGTDKVLQKDIPAHNVEVMITQSLNQANKLADEVKGIGQEKEKASLRLKAAKKKLEQLKNSSDDDFNPAPYTPPDRTIDPKPGAKLRRSEHDPEDSLVKKIEPGRGTLKPNELNRIDRGEPNSITVPTFKLPDHARSEHQPTLAQIKSDLVSKNPALANNPAALDGQAKAVKNNNESERQKVALAVWQNSDPYKMYMKHQLNLLCSDFISHRYAQLIKQHEGNPRKNYVDDTPEKQQAKLALGKKPILVSVVERLKKAKQSIDDYKVKIERKQKSIEDSHPIFRAGINPVSDVSGIETPDNPKSKINQPRPNTEFGLAGQKDEKWEAKASWSRKQMETFFDKMGEMTHKFRSDTHYRTQEVLEFLRNFAERHNGGKDMPELELKVFVSKPEWAHASQDTADKNDDGSPASFSKFRPVDVAAKTASHQASVAKTKDLRADRAERDKYLPDNFDNLSDDEQKEALKLANTKYMMNRTFSEDIESESETMNEGKQAGKAKKKLQDYLDKKPRDPNAVAAKTRSGAGAHKNKEEKRIKKITPKDVEEAVMEPNEESLIQEGLMETVRLQQLAGIKILREYLPSAVSSSKSEMDAPGFVMDDFDDPDFDSSPLTHVTNEEPSDEEPITEPSPALPKPMGDQMPGLGNPGQDDSGSEFDDTSDDGMDDMEFDIDDGGGMGDDDDMGDDDTDMMVSPHDSLMGPDEPDDLGMGMPTAPEPAMPSTPTVHVPLGVPSPGMPGAGMPANSPAYSLIQDNLNNIQKQLSEIKMSEYKVLVSRLETLAQQIKTMGMDYLGENRKRK